MERIDTYSHEEDILTEEIFEELTDEQLEQVVGGIDIGGDETQWVVLLLSWEESSRMWGPAEYILDGIFIKGPACMDEDRTSIAASKVTIPILDPLGLDLGIDELLRVCHPCCPRVPKTN